MHIEARHASGTEMELKEKWKVRVRRKATTKKQYLWGNLTEPRKKSSRSWNGRGKKIFFGGGDHEGNQPFWVSSQKNPYVAKVKIHQGKGIWEKYTYISTDRQGWAKAGLRL